MIALDVDPSGCLFRNTALFHTVAQSMDCPHTPYSMAKYWHGVRPWQDSLSLWKRARRGVTPAPNTRSQLFGHFPQLRKLYDNPLWAVTSHTEWGGEWDELADSIRLAGEPLDGYGGKLSTLLFDRADWPCLAVHLVLLHTHSDRYLFHRWWLAKNFTGLFALSSIQRPICHICAELHATLTPQMLTTEPVPVHNWEHCHAICAAHQDLLDLLRELGWLQGDDQHLALLIWNFRQELQRELNVGPQQLIGRTECRLPRSLRQKWYRKLAQWQEHPVTLNGVCCEFPHDD
ncbi:hypothetical protein KC131_25595 [Pseudomonas sp. JQ170]|uniref:hypothetical protein n=1 Tax=Pseudomonas sp. JQ170C TaxID=3110111 RepID=UPI002653FC88|nr:hypothetical protein [Pseudomonas sp. 170C]MDN7144023.1 hypothetical protein [Pseudomonas sp. JQ170]WRO74989.1 hypothetical protein U9R80_21170 [Pseudomonas sp. 170C]